MSELSWVRIRSWHTFRGFSRSGAALTRCGRRVGDMDSPPEIVDALPAGRSCESCLRIVAREADR